MREILGDKHINTSVEDCVNELKNSFRVKKDEMYIFYETAHVYWVSSPENTVGEENPAGLTFND